MSLFTKLSAKIALALSLVAAASQTQAETAIHKVDGYRINYGKTSTYLGTYKHQIYIDVTTQAEPKTVRNIALIFMNGKLPANTKDANRCSETIECFTLFFPVSDYKDFLDVLKEGNKVVSFDPSTFELQVIAMAK